MDNPNINNNEALYRSQIREFFEDRFGAYLDEGHYISELKSFRNTVEAAEENDTTVGNYGSYDAIYATRKDVIIGFIEYWLTEGYQRFNQNNKFMIILPVTQDDAEQSLSIDTDIIHFIGDVTNFSTIYNDIFYNIKTEWQNTIATKEFAIRVIQPNYLGFTFVGSSSINIYFTNGVYSNLNLEYSYDGITWNTVQNNTNITLNPLTDGINANTLNNSILLFRGDNTALCSLNESNYIGRFHSSNNNIYLYCFGSIQSLIYKEDTQNKYIACDDCFYGLFSNMSFESLPELPATVLKEKCYEYMFQNCNITILGSTFQFEKQYEILLPATTMAPYCYSYMFYNSDIAGTLIELPATTLAPYCYTFMFALSSINTYGSSIMYLPATKMEEGCYVSMFDTCTSITTAPMLPAYKLAKNCYFKMFAACSSLTQAPELPAIELAPGCYDSMFHSCTSLEIAPELPAKKLPQQCYSSMFAGCTNLKYVKALFTEITCGTSGAINSNPNSSHSSIYNWLSSTNTNSTSKVILHTDLLYSKDYENWTIGHSLTGAGNWVLAPTNWQIYGTRNYLHFKPSPESNCKSWNLAIRIAKFDTVRYDGSYLNLNYKTTYDISVNPSTGAITEYPWTTINGYIDPNTAITNQTVPTTEGSSPLISIPFGEDGVYICNALDYEDRDPEMDRRWRGYINIYSGSSSGTYHTHFDCIPQNTSTPRYIDMFGDLRSIFYMDNTFEQYDELPNSTYHKYWSEYARPGYMFYSNTYLRHCYTSCNVKQFNANMYEAAFANCPNLIYLPNLGTDPSMSLNSSTFNSAFGQCTSLEYVPELPYLTYAEEDWTNDGNDPDGYSDFPNAQEASTPTNYKEVTGCYRSMFYECKNMKYIPNILPLRHLCTALYAGVGMFNSDKYRSTNVLNKMPEIIAVKAADSSCYGMFYGQLKLKETKCLPMVELDKSSLWDMFNNAGIKTAMHILPALSITKNTYSRLFYNCKNLVAGPKIQATQIIGSYSNSAISNIYYSNSNLKYANTSMNSTVSSSQFTFAGSNTEKLYDDDSKNSDKSGMLYVHTGQYDGLSQGYYKAALLQYSLNFETNKYDFDGEYWIYVKSRKFADGNTYYIWRKYYEGAVWGNISSGNLYTSYENHYLYLITKECIIPSCTVTSFSSAWSYKPTSITTKYTVIGYAYADFNNFNERFENSGNLDYIGEESKFHDMGPRVYPKVLMTIAE